MFGRRSTPAESPAAAGHGHGQEKVKTPTGPVTDEAPAEFEQLWAPEKAKVRKSVDQLLLERGIVTEEHLDQARKVAAQTPGKTLAQILLTMSAASEAQILAALAETLGLEFVTPKREQVEQRAFDSLPLDFIKKHAVLPLRFENGKL